MARPAGCGTLPAIGHPSQRAHLPPRTTKAKTYRRRNALFNTANEVVIHHAAQQRAWHTLVFLLYVVFIVCLSRRSHVLPDGESAARGEFTTTRL